MKPAVWGVFVGDRGSDLDSFNSANGPFPPAAGADGYIAIGWVGMGNMGMFTNERTLKTQANMVWSFAFTMQLGDYVICPSTATGHVLIGRISSGYESDAENGVSVARYKKRHDLMHLRRVPMNTYPAPYAP